MILEKKFSLEDWKELEKDFFHWTDFQREIFTSAIMEIQDFNVVTEEVHTNSIYQSKLESIAHRIDFIDTILKTTLFHLLEKNCSLEIIADNIYFINHYFSLIEKENSDSIDKLKGLLDFYQSNVIVKRNYLENKKDFDILNEKIKKAGNKV